MVESTVKREAISAQLEIPSKRSFPIVDIGIVIVVSFVSYLAEGWARAAGWIPLGEESRGVVAVLAGAFTALAVNFARGGSWRDLGFFRPKRLWTIPFWAIGIFVAYVFFQALAVGLLSLVFEIPQPDLSRYEPYHGNLGVAIAFAFLLPFTASIPEEIIYRGFLMGRLTKLFGETRKGAALTVLTQASLFGAVHFQWGLGGILVTVVMGLVWGTSYLLCGRNLWIVIAAHSLGHVGMAVQLYFAPVANS